MLVDINFMENHHIDNEPSNNKITNIPPIHGLCNRQLNGAKGGEVNRQRAAAFKERFSNVSSVSVSERSTSGGALTRYEVTDDIDADNFSEGRKHEEQRARWNDWIHNLETGIFRAVRATIRRQLLADKAVYGLSKDDKPYGSSVTYLRFIREDVAGGIFDQYKEGGIIFVRYLGPRTKTKEQTGQ
jgi:hypothetical protein